MSTPLSLENRLAQAVANTNQLIDVATNLHTRTALLEQKVQRIATLIQSTETLERQNQEDCTLLNRDVAEVHSNTTHIKLAVAGIGGAATGVFIAVVGGLGTAACPPAALIGAAATVATVAVYNHCKRK